MQSLWRFLAYNNTVPITLGIIFLGAGSAFAASPQAREAVFSSAEEVRSVDNTYIASADLEQHDFATQVTSVLEDGDIYYVTYTYQTVALVEDVWQRTGVERTLKVSKKELEGGDLGLFVAKQIGQNIAAERTRLAQTQELERGKGVTHKVVATVYSGLVGQMLDPEEKEFPGYAPVIAEKPRPNSGTLATTTSVAGESVDAAPRLLSEAEVERLIEARVQALLANGNAPDTTVATNTPPPSTSSTSDVPPEPEPSGGSSSGSATPPPATSGGGGSATSSSTPPATTTPAAPAASSTPAVPPTEPPASTTPPAPPVEPEPEPEQPAEEPEPAPEVPDTEGEPAA